MIGARAIVPYGDVEAYELIGHDDARRAPVEPQFPKEAFGRLGISLFLDQDFQYITPSVEETARRRLAQNNPPRINIRLYMLADNLAQLQLTRHM